MSEPRRLRELHEGDIFGAALRAADRDAPESDADAKLLAALGVTASAIAATTTTTATTTTAAAGSTGVAAKVSSGAFALKWILGGLVLVSGALGAALVMRPESQTREAQNPGDVNLVGSNSAPISRHEPAIAPAAPSPVPTDESAAPLSSSSADRATHRTKPKPPQAPAGAHPAATCEATSIGPELEAIDRARTLLASGRAAEALAVVDGYQRAFPAGALGQEAVAIRLDALVRLGQRSVAEDEAREFLARHPESPQAPRIRALVRR